MCRSSPKEKEDTYYVCRWRTVCVAVTEGWKCRGGWEWAVMWLQQSEWGEGRFCATGDEAVEVMDMS